MATLINIRFPLVKKTSNVLRQFCAFMHESTGESMKNAQFPLEDEPVSVTNPYEKEKPQCILCKYDIEPNYKNVRLLSQFISRHTGKVYGRHITGLCKHKQLKVEKEIRRARMTGLMAYVLKEPKYFDDPSLYDEVNPIRPKYI